MVVPSLRYRAANRASVGAVMGHTEKSFQVRYSQRMAHRSKSRRKYTLFGGCGLKAVCYDGAIEANATQYTQTERQSTMSGNQVDFTGSVISGTMREQDLVPAFMDVLEEYGNATLVAHIKEEFQDVFAALDAGIDPYDMTDETGEGLAFLVQDLFDHLDELAPKGHYFGAHWGDGADYGYWPLEDYEEEEGEYYSCI